MALNLKPVATSAATTAFCSAKIEGPGGLFLWIDGNGKITAGNGTLDDPKPNAFSLVHIKDCPGSTVTCRASCYVHGLAKHAPDTFALYEHNSETIRKILADKKLAYLWAREVAYWIHQNCKGGFRWHVSGDIFSAVYADWIVLVCTLSPDVKHWIYTRSLHLLPNLMPVSMTKGGNLAINVSLDASNWRDAMLIANELGLRKCLMVEKIEFTQALCGMNEGDVIFPDYPLRGGTDLGAAWFQDVLLAKQRKMTCPVDYHGKSEKRRCGPCNRCMI